MTANDVIAQLRERGNEFGLLNFRFGNRSFSMPKLQVFISPWQEWSKVKKTTYVVGEGCYSLQDFVYDLPLQDNRFSKFVGIEALAKHLESAYKIE